MNSDSEVKFLLWEERDRKRRPAQSILNGVAYYMDKFNVQPRVVYVHAANQGIEVEGVQVLLVPPGKLVVQPNQFAIGRRELV